MFGQLIDCIGTTARSVQSGEEGCVGDLLKIQHKHATDSFVNSYQSPLCLLGWRTLSSKINRSK